MSGSSMRGGRTRKFKSEINVVPYIDVMLVLLIIFMVATPITNPSVINLPNAGKANVPPTSYVNIALKPDSKATIGISGQKTKGSGATQTASSRTDLVQKLSELHADNPDLPVMVSADKDIKYDEVIQVLSEAKKLGIARVGLATR